MKFFIEEWGFGFFLFTCFVVLANILNVFLALVLLIADLHH
jgi:hypothetical protein